MKSLFICLIVVFALISCEYKADSEYYRDLEPPSTSIPLEINLNDVDPSDTIYIMDVTRLTLKVNTYGKSLKNVQFMLDHHRIGSGNEVIIYPNDLDDGKYKLTVVVDVSSGSGSLADMMGMEGYEGEMSWNIRIMRDFDPGLKLGFRKNADHKLEFYWETSTYIPKSIFERYEVRGDVPINITDQDRKSVVFEDYVCGWTAGSVDLHIKCIDGYSRYYHQALSFESPMPNLYFEALDVSRLRIYWDKPFIDAKYELIAVNTIIPSIYTSDTTVVVASPPFTVTQGYQVKMYPKNSTKTETNAYISGGYRIGDRVIISANDVDFYNVKNQLFAVYYRQLFAINLQTFAEMHQIDLVEPGAHSKISCVPGSSKIAVKQNYSFFVYPDDSFINPVIVYKSDNWITNFFKLTNNDHLFIVDWNECEVFDINTGAMRFRFDVVEYPASRSVSADGKYFCCASSNGLTIYSIGSSAVDNVTTITGSYSNALFNPANPQQLIVKQGNEIQILEAPDFHSIYTFSAPYSTLLDVDPANGNILYHQRYTQMDSLHVIRTTPFIKPVFAIAISGVTTNYIKLRGNLLMEHLHNNYSIDITPYINLGE